MLSKLLVAAVMALPLLATALPAVAQETVLGSDADTAAPAASAAPAPQAPPPLAWASRCVSDGRQSTANCSIEQRLLMQGSNELVGAVTIQALSSGKPAIIANVPLGLYIPGGVSIDVDGAANQKLDLQTCDRTGCFATAQLADATLAAMQKGKKLDLVFQSVSKRTVTLPLQLPGFTAAYQKIK